MDIIVCAKRVPDVTGAEIRIAGDGRSIRQEGLVFDTNDWDKYAVEEAVRLKEKHGGTVTVITAGSIDAEEMLRRCFVTGCEQGICLTCPAPADTDPMVTARVLHKTIHGMKFDLILTGVQASDDGCGQVGPLLAGLLGIPHATLVSQIEVLDGKVMVHRELESGMSEAVEVKLPALLTIQTGINEPRYVSVRALMKVADREIKTLNAAESGQARTRIDRLFIPPVTRKTGILPSEAGAAAASLLEILEDRGLLD